MTTDKANELPTPAREWNRDCITLTALQLRHALDFAAPDFDTDEDQRETQVSIAWGPDGATTDDEGNPDPAGYKVWMTDYPEEGSIPLDESPAGCPVKSAERGRSIAAATLASQATAELPSLKADFEAAMRKDGYKLDFLVLEGSDRYAYMETEWAFRGYEAGRASRAQSELTPRAVVRKASFNVPSLPAFVQMLEHVRVEEYGSWKRAEALHRWLFLAGQSVTHQRPDCVVCGSAIESADIHETRCPSHQTAPTHGESCQAWANSLNVTCDVCGATPICSHCSKPDCKDFDKDACSNTAGFYHGDEREGY